MTDQREFFPPPSDPMAVAAQILAEEHYGWRDGLRLGGTSTLRYWRKCWMRWDTTRWVEVDKEIVLSELYHRLRDVYYVKVDKKGNTEEKKWEPGPSKIRGVMEATRVQTVLDSITQPPSWLDPSRSQGQIIVSCTNGLLDVASRTLADHTPVFFNEVAVPFAYDPNCPPPTEWLAFLHQVWPGDPDSIALLQQWFGYILSGATNQQKILGIIGPTRSGKGTIGRILTGLIGEENVSALTASGFGQHFGLQALVDKSVCIIGDLRLRGGQHSVVERLLSISGEDTVTTDRKGKSHWTGRVPTRVMFVSNELPRLPDASGAVASRCLILETTTSFLGHEDVTLTPRLLNELPGILNWSLDGLTALTRAGRFTEPQSSLDARIVLLDLASPMSAFVRDCCQRSGHVEVERLWTAWVQWCNQTGNAQGTKQKFRRDLRAVASDLTIVYPKVNGVQVRAYTPLSLI